MTKCQATVSGKWGFRVHLSVPQVRREQDLRSVTSRHHRTF